MMNLVCRPAGVVLICSGCAEEWSVHEAQPFVSQLRLVALGHSCLAGIAAGESVEAGRRGHLRLVTDA